MNIKIINKTDEQNVKWRYLNANRLADLINLNRRSSLDLPLWAWVPNRLPFQMVAKLQPDSAIGEAIQAAAVENRSFEETVGERAEENRGC